MTAPDPTLMKPASPGPRVNWAFSVRAGGVSQGPWGDLDGRGGLNLGAACGDDPAAVRANRAALAALLGRPVRWLDQVHGVRVVDCGSAPADPESPPRADAQVSATRGTALAILVADCLPVLLADRDGRIVGAAHAGWRGLAGGVVEATVAAMRARVPDARLSAWLGPCIGPQAFEVGDDVRDAFTATAPDDAVAFVRTERPGKWMADLAGLARRRLMRIGIDRIDASGDCTVADPARYWSYRRDRTCGRMAALVWLD